MNPLFSLTAALLAATARADDPASDAHHETILKRILQKQLRVGEVRELGTDSTICTKLTGAHVAALREAVTDCHLKLAPECVVGILENKSKSGWENLVEDLVGKKERTKFIETYEDVFCPREDLFDKKEDFKDIVKTVCAVHKTKDMEKVMAAKDKKIKDLEVEAEKLRKGGCAGASFASKACVIAALGALLLLV